MKTLDLITLGKNISISINLEDLRKWHKEILEDTKRELEQIVISDKAETYPTPKQVSEILQVDLSTLWRWNRKGYLKHIEIGGKRRYKMSDVKSILNGGRRNK